MQFGIFESNANGRIELSAANCVNRAIWPREFIANSNSSVRPHVVSFCRLYDPDDLGNKVAAE
jgi:hypothetical protein